jgi:Na+-driven multidrug efflux pump
VLFFGAEWFVRLFTRDPATISYAASFAQVYGLVAPLTALWVVLAGALQGGSDTTTPFVARTTAMFGFMVGASYVLAVPLGYGVPGIYAGIGLHYVWPTAVVVWGFARGGWAERATRMMAERGSVSEAE